MDVTEDRVRNIVENVNPGAVGPDGSIEEGVLDSLDIVTLVADFEEGFGLSIDVEHIVPDNFASLDTMAAFLKKIKDGE